jgi:hypothetical protein
MQDLQIWREFDETRHLFQIISGGAVIGSGRWLVHAQPNNMIALSPGNVSSPSQFREQPLSSEGKIMSAVPLDLTDDERDALIRFLRDAIEGTRYPMSPRLAALRAILAKLEEQPSPRVPPPSARETPTPPAQRPRRSRR